MLFNELPKQLFPANKISDLFDVYVNPTISVLKFSSINNMDTILDLIRDIDKTDYANVNGMAYNAYDDLGKIVVEAGLRFNNRGRSMYDYIDSEYEINDGTGHFKSFIYGGHEFFIDVNEPNLSTVEMYIILPFKIENYDSSMDIRFLASNSISTSSKCINTIFHKTGNNLYEKLRSYR